MTPTADAPRDDLLTIDNGSRATDDPRERQHAEVGDGSRHWWRCIPITTADQWVAEAADAALRAAREAVANLRDFYGISVLLKLPFDPDGTELRLWRELDALLAFPDAKKP